MIEIAYLRWLIYHHRNTYPAACKQWWLMLAGPWEIEAQWPNAKHTRSRYVRTNENMTDEP